MAEQSPVSSNDLFRPSERMFDPYTSPDNFLQALVRLANVGLEIGVTLTMGGFLVSGIIVGGKRYFREHLMESLGKDTPAETKMQMIAFFETFAKLYDVPPEGLEVDELITSFIHLRDARLFHHAGKPIPGNQPIWWRGRLSEVQGFSMGNLSHENN